MSKKRKLLDGREVEELLEPISLTIFTRCPKKWQIKDLETGQTYEATGETKIQKQWKKKNA